MPWQLGPQLGRAGGFVHQNVSRWRVSLSILLISTLLPGCAAGGSLAQPFQPNPSPVPRPTPAIPEGKPARMAFETDRDGNSEIYVMDPESVLKGNYSGLTNLTNNPANDSDPTWSPDRKQIAFMSDRDKNPEIYIMNSDGSEQTRLTSLTGQIWEPTWSGDGKRIAFTRDYEIYSIGVDGSGVSNVTNNPAADYHPAWSPDGSRIAFVSERDGKVAIYSMNADGTNVQRLTDGDFASMPAWSRDGRRLAYLSVKDGRGGLVVMNADGANPVLLMEDAKFGGDMPAWSPDGKQIAFDSTRDGNLEIYLINIDSKRIIRLTANPAHDRAPAW